MGAFSIQIVGVGGHGCDRKAKPGEKLYGRCGRFGCPDCLTYDFVQRLRQAGMVREGDQAQGQELKDGDEPPTGTEVYYTDAEHRLVPAPVAGGKRFWRKFHQATFTHWPGDPGQVVDDLLKNERQSGQF